MSELYPVPQRVRDGSCSAIQNLDQYREHYYRAYHDPDGYWLEITKKIVRWRKEPTIGLVGDFLQIQEEPIAWFSDGRLNLTETCLDQHLESRGDKVAIVWEGDEPGDTRSITYRELHSQVCRFANGLKSIGVQKGERVIIYMGMVVETAVAMLACARLGAIHSVVFGGFSFESLRDRVRDCGAKYVITQDEGRRGGRPLPLKAVVDRALDDERSVKHVVVYRRTGAQVDFHEGRDLWWDDVMEGQSEECAATIMAAEDPLFILYTSGSTGKPKGLVHTTGGYLTFVAYTHATVFDLREDDVYACLADVGWVTGHSYILYGPLANGATTMMFESTPLYPDPGRYWDMVERHKITIFYTAPTALRALAAQDASYVKRYDRSSLRVLGTVGEPINPEAWIWYHNVVGEGRCSIVDTWWQTETGGICISPIASATPTAPGSATLPLPGIAPVLLDSEGFRVRGPGEGRLCLVYPWPGQARTVWEDHDRYVATYFSTFRGFYFTGDGCRRDSQGYHWITGRVDDVINVSGHRMGTAEFESALVNVDEVAEAAVVGYPHDIKGQGVYVYAVLQPEYSPSPEIEQNMRGACREAIGAHAGLDLIQFVPELPKTRSGKVMRRILRKIAEGDGDKLGDISTLANPEVVEQIYREYQKE